jgi:hypothetical protein
MNTIDADVFPLFERESIPVQFIRRPLEKCFAPYRTPNPSQDHKTNATN